MTDDLNQSRPESTRWSTDADSAASRNATEPAGAPTPLGFNDPAFAQRYGIKRGMSRTRKILLAVFGFALLCGVAVYIAWNEANPKIQATVVSYTVNGNAVNVTFQVNKAADQRVECTLEAEDVHGSVIGSANVIVPAGRAEEDMVYTVNSTGTPNTVVVSSCTAAS
jgi:phage shock protein PspC (stress-responsive transcriptional regulator)